MTDRDGIGFTLRQRTDLVAQVVGTDTVAIAQTKGTEKTEQRKLSLTHLRSALLLLASLLRNISVILC